MPFANGGRSVPSSLQIRSPGLVVAQRTALHYGSQLANEMSQRESEMAYAASTVTPQMAFDLAKMSDMYPDLPASVLTGAAASGIDAYHPALSSLNERMGYARTINPIGNAASNILGIPFDFVRGGVRLATTAFMSIYEEGISRPVRTAVGVSQGMGLGDAYSAAGSSAGIRAIGTFLEDPVGNLTPAASSPEGQVNLGSGWLPQSNVADANSVEVQMLEQMGVPQPNAIAQVQQGYGDPLTQIAREQAHTGVTFDDGLSISPGRLVAKGIGLEAGTMPFHIVSGAADFGSQLFLDPTNLALWGLGKARLWNKMLIGNGTRKTPFGVHVDDYLASPDYSNMTQTLATMSNHLDIKNALSLRSYGKSVEGLETRTLVDNIANARNSRQVDEAIRPYFGASDEAGKSLPMFTQAPTPRSILNPSASRRTFGQVMGGRFEGEAGRVGETFGLKAAVRHNAEGSWAGRMFSQMPGHALDPGDMDRAFDQVEDFLNSAGFTAEEAGPYMARASRLADGDAPGAYALVRDILKDFTNTKIPDASPEIKAGFERVFNADYDTFRKFWTDFAGGNQWFPDVELAAIVDDGRVAVSRPMAQMVDELANTTIPLPDPRQIRRALSDESTLKLAKLTSHVDETGRGTAELSARAWTNVLDGYMQKVWKPFVLMRVAWPVRVVMEEQLRMSAAGLDSMFRHPMSWFAYAFQGKMNRTLLGELSPDGKAGVIMDYRPQGQFDEFQEAMAKGAGGWADFGGSSMGNVKYVNVWRDMPEFADAWLWNLGKSHADPVMAYLRKNGIDETVAWLRQGGGRQYLKQLTESANPVQQAYLGGTATEVTESRLRWYVEGLHARQKGLAGADYIWWDPHTQSWRTSANQAVDNPAQYGVDPLGPQDPGPMPGRNRPDGTDGPSPVDGIPEGGKPTPPNPNEAQPMPRVAAMDRPLSATDPVQTTLNFGDSSPGSYSTMGYQMASNGYDPHRGFATFANEMNKAYDEPELFTEALASYADGESFSSINAVIDDLARTFAGPDGNVDDVRLTQSFNDWVEHSLMGRDEAESISNLLVEAINIRHQQQLDMLNYVYPQRLSSRSQATDILTDAKRWEGVQLLKANLAPEQLDEVRFIYRFMDMLGTNETAWGRDARAIVDSLFDNYGNEFLTITRDSPLVARLNDMAELQVANRNLRSLRSLDPLDIDEVAEGAMRSGDPLVITGHAHMEGDNAASAGIYTNTKPGRADASITIENYQTFDLAATLETVLATYDERALVETFERFAAESASEYELHSKVADFLIQQLKGQRGATVEGPNPAYIFQSPISDTNPALRGVSEEIRAMFNELQGAWFDRSPTGTLMDLTERRVVPGGYDGVWSSSDRANFVNAVTESGAFTDQGGQSIANVIEVLQARDSGMTRGWLETLGREITKNPTPPSNKPMPLRSLHELETATTRELADEMVQLAAGFHGANVAADSVFRSLKPGASIDTGIGVEGRLVDNLDELTRRQQVASAQGVAAEDAFVDELADAIQQYAQLEEVDADDLASIVNWVDQALAGKEMRVAPSRAVWPKHSIDDFDPVSQPHLYGDPEGFRSLPDDAEVWVFTSTDPQTARAWLVDGINPVDKPIDKTLHSGDYMPGHGLDTGTYAAADPYSLHFYGTHAGQRSGAGNQGMTLAVKVRKGDLKASGEFLESGMKGDVGEALANAGTGATFEIPVPAGNIRAFGVEASVRSGEVAKSTGGGIKRNIAAGQSLDSDSLAAIRRAETAGYRVEVVSTDDYADIWIMDRDRMIRIQDREVDINLDDITAYLEGDGPAPESNMFVREYVAGGGIEVLDDIDVLTVNDAIDAVIRGRAANAPRPGFRYLLEQPYGRTRIKDPFSIHRVKGIEVNIDGLPIDGGAKAALKSSLPDAPKAPAAPPKPPALGPGKQPLAIEAPGGTPPAGFPGRGGMNDPNYEMSHYKIIKDSNPELDDLIESGEIDEIPMFLRHDPETHADSMATLSDQHAALRDRIDNAPPVLPTPDPTFTPDQMGQWDKAVTWMFSQLMSKPTNKLSRSPAFKQFYLERALHMRSWADDATRAELDRVLQADMGLKASDLRRRNPTPPGWMGRGRKASGGIDITLRDIDTVSKAYALEETRKLLYDLSKKHDASDVLRNIFPFAEAWGEIITVWSKIMWENPRMFRRAQQGVEGAREQGWFYNNDNGEEVFAYPGSEFVTKAMLGTGDDTEVRLTGTTAGVNLALGQYVPGFGPVVQVPASMLIPNMPTFDSVRKFLMPFGDEEVRTPGDILNLALPSWYEKAMIAIGTGDANYRRLHNNTVMDVYKILAAENPDKLGSTAQSYSLMEEASRKASVLSWIRAGASFFSPTSPQIEYNVADTDGTMWQMQAMTAEYYRLLRTSDFDQQAALTSFIQRFGFGDGLLDGIGVASTFITSKSVEVQERLTSEDGYAWQRDNGDLFEPSAFPYTAAYAMQDLEWDDFDYSAYLDGLKAGTREPVTPDEWLLRRNKLVGNIAFDTAKAQVAGRDDRGARLWIRDMRIKLAHEYPGFDADIAGLPQRPDTDTMIMEIERWSQDERLSQSNAGQGAAVYMALRRRAEAQAYGMGLMPDSWRTAKSMVAWREWLRTSADEIMQVFPEFGQLWFDVFRWELTEDETPEVLALEGMTF